jgi:iron complex outermembrane receptor protein
VRRRVSEVQGRGSPGLAGALAAAIAAGFCGHAQAQRVDENAVEQAQDAFGSTVGDEQVGLYSSEDARGFSPKDAGNLVIEGLYYDQQTYGPSARTTEGSTLRVGLAAQSYPLAAPTGVVDYHLRMPGAERITSISLGVGPFDQGYVEVDTHFPLTPELSIGLGGSYEINPGPYFAQRSRGPGAGAIARWQPAPGVEVVPFVGWYGYSEEQERPLVYLAGSALPPEFDQRKLTGQRWSEWSSDDFDYGVLGRVDLQRGWTLRAGLFGSQAEQNRSRLESYYDAGPDGLAQYYVSGVPEQSYRSYSGELRASKVVVEQSRRHTVHLIARARDNRRLYGGDDERFIETTTIGSVPIIDQPAFVAGPRSRIDTDQQNLGVAYALLWKGLGELGLGVQRARVERETLAGGDSAAVATTDETTLYNASIAAHAGPRLTLYASYSRGLEEAGIAPENAVNRREAAPLILSEQVDAGMRYTISKTSSVVLGVFEIEKPYYGLSAQSVFTELATVTHRGVEASLAGELFEGLNVVAGYVYLDAELSGPAVDDGALGEVAVGPIPRVATLDLSYGPERWKGFALEAAVQYQSDYVASQDNLLTVPSLTEIDLGFRYRFSLGKAPVSLRFEAENVADRRTWEVKSSGEAKMTEGRRYALTLTTDLR